MSDDVQSPNQVRAWPEARTEDVASIEALIAAFDACLSFDPGEFGVRIDRLRSLFLPTANIVAAAPWNIVTDADGFANFFMEAIPQIGADETGLCERNAIVRSLSIGDVHSIDTYYTLHMPPSNPEPMGRGVNMFHIVRVDGRYWIASCIWEDESETAPTPPELVPG